MGGRGRRHGPDERRKVIELVQNACTRGARLDRACTTLGLPARTVQRWKLSGGDQRRGPKSPCEHALSADEKAQVVAIATSAEYRNLSAEQIVAKLADNGRYVASERSFRRVLKAHRLSTYRQRCKPATKHKPRQYVANGPMQVLSWDITYLRMAHVRGGFFYLYMFEDIWSRRIVAAEVFDEQSDVHASAMLRKLHLEQQLGEACVLHSDNGAPMKGSTMLATLQSLGVSSSFSRPGVSDDNPFIESLFGT